MKHIIIELSPESCDRALEELKAYQSELLPKMDEVCRRLAEIGIMEAQMHISQANGNTDVRIESTPIKIPNGYKVVMNGKDAYFVEFGTGDDVNAYTPNVTVLVAPGSWSETHARRYMDYGFWYYAGVRYEGTPAYMPMYYAGKAIRDNTKRIMREVFGKT